MGSLTQDDGDDDASFGRALGEVRHLELADEASVRTELFARMGIDPRPVRLGGRYTLGRALGQGGAGAVYSARDDQLARDVAIKLVRIAGLDGPDDTASERRLQREARAVARLAHPNIVAVFDLGRYDHGELAHAVEGAAPRGLYLVMERVDGGDLLAWTATCPSRAARIDALIAAARGLHAAHCAGLVHRDFKPANVLIARDGTVKIADFGLARPPAGSLGDGPSASSSSDGAEAADAMEVTAHGLVVGTVPYMAPEQFRGICSAASDQYAFCVTAVEVLLGARPFVGSAADQLAAKRAARIPILAQLPPRLRAALRRGLSPAPEQRFESMLALIEAIAPRARGRVAALGAFGILTVIGAGWMLAPADTCTPLLEVASELGRVPESDPTTTTALHDVAARLRASHATCVALDDPNARACMGEHGRHHGRMLATLGEAGVDAAAMVRAFHELPSADECVASRAAAAIPPEVLREGVAAVREQLAVARALADAGLFDAASSEAGEAGARAQRLGWAPLRVEAEIVQAYLQFGLGGFDDAEVALVEAYWAAIELDDGTQAERAAEILARVHGRPGGNRAESERWEARAALALERIGRPPLAEARLAAIRGANRNVWHEEAAATEEFRHALALLDGLDGDYHRQIATLSSNLGEMLTRAGEYDEAERALLRAIELGEPSGTGSVPAIVHLSTLRREQQRLDDAERLLNDAIARLDSAAPSGHPWRGQLFNNLGVVATRRPDFAAAADAFATAVASHEQLGLRDAAWAGYHKNWAAAAAKLGDWSTAAEHYVLALDVLAGADARRDQALVGLAEVELARGELAAAARRLREVDPAVATRDPETATRLGVVGERLAAAEAELLGSSP